MWGHVDPDPCPAPVCAVQCAQVGLSVNIGSAGGCQPKSKAKDNKRSKKKPKHKAAAKRKAKQTGADREGKSKRRRKGPLEAHGRPGAQLSLWMPPPGLQARPGRPLAAFFVPHNSSFGRLPF